MGTENESGIFQEHGENHWVEPVTCKATEYQLEEQGTHCLGGAGGGAHGGIE